MKNNLKKIASWLFEQGAELSREILEEKLQEAYEQGQLDTYHEQVNTTLDNILYNTINKIKSEKKKLYEENFYTTPSDEDVVKMRAYEYLSDNIGDIIKSYRES